MTFIMILTSMPVHLLAAYDYTDLSNDKSKIINNKTPVKVAKPEAGKTAEDLIKNPKQPDIYTLRTDYKVKRGEKYKVNYQPYIASVGAGASDAEKAKVIKKIKLPTLAGYDKPSYDDFYNIDYNIVKNAANGKEESGNDIIGKKFKANKEFKYDAISKSITVKHVFQKIDNFEKYTNPDGTITNSDGSVTNTDGKTTPKEKVKKEHRLLSYQPGNTGSTMEVSPLIESKRKGFIPEAEHITMQVPDDASDFVMEYRYKRACYGVVFDTKGGTSLDTRTCYYGQEIPEIDTKNIPKKEGSIFEGWMPSHDLESKNNKKYKANEIIKKDDGTPSLDLAVGLEMPALDLGKDENTREKLTFTAVWKELPKADYAVQFWAEKSDHADNASLSEKYEYMGTRVIKKADTNSRLELDAEPVDGVQFPDLDDARLKKIWKETDKNHPYLNKFFVYNKELTEEQNEDSKNENLVKKVESTGKTVYNIYYDRQVYNLYFTKSNVAGSAFYPEISKDGKEVGKEGNPYHFKARFNQSMVGLWPDDVKEVRGFNEGNNSLGWLPNLKNPKYFYRDTPPYRLSANLFIDFPELEKQGGYVSEIDLGNGKTKKASITDLSFGIDQNSETMPHHIDFWLDDFDGEQVIDYDLYTIKSDVNNSGYNGFLPPDLQGFTPKKTGGRGSEFKDESDFDDLNEEREETTPFPKVYFKELDEEGEPKQKGKLYFMKYFPNGDGREFDQNGYLKFEYSRNKYKLRFNYDPSRFMDDNDFNNKNELETPYQFPLKALSPDADTEESYKTGNPKNLIDNPKKLQELGLTDLVFTDKKDGKLKVKRPDGLSDQMVFKGWAADPAGKKLISDINETMPAHNVVLFAKWGEPNNKLKVTFDPNGGNLKSISEEKLTTERKKIQEGDVGQEKENTYAKKGYLEEAPTGKDGEQIFTVIQRQKLVKPKDPVRKGYDFMGWEIIRYKKDSKGDYTDTVDNEYRTRYKVPELYTFGNDVVAPVYLKAVWVPNEKVDVKVYHHLLDKNCAKTNGLDDKVDILEDKKTGYYTATVGDQQGQEWILAPDRELKKSQDPEIKKLYEKYNNEFHFNNSYFQNQRIEPEKIKDPNSDKMIKNPNYKGNEFHFFYRPYRHREFKVNYIDERGKKEIEDFYKNLGLEDTAGLTGDALLKAQKANKKKFEANKQKLEEIIKKYKVIDPEDVSDDNRHFDARNYRPIPGWKLAGKPQQQLFFDVNEDTNEFLGINGTGGDQIFFYYKDARVIEVPKDGKTPEGYVRVTFKAEKGGSFGKDAEDKDVTELNYDVIKGLKSQLLPVPKELAEGETADKDRHYITPETGKKFIKWDKSPLLNDNTIINENHTFTACFEWSGLSATGLVRTEAFKDSNGKWTNDFAPKIEDLKKQLVWMEKGEKKPLPTGARIQLYDEAGNELTKDDQVYDLVNEKNKADKDELVRTVNVKAKVTFTDGKDPQELDIPITVYKNVYEALTAGEKPLFLSQAEGKEAKDGGLKDLTGNYVKVTVNPTGKPGEKDSKIYYVNPKAWVDIKEIDISDVATNLGFTNWSADKDGQNENGVFDFSKRHKFTEDTVITPGFSNDVIPQTGTDKPKVPGNYVKVIIKTTDKAVTEFTKKFWVNPTKTVTIPVVKPVGKTVDKTATEAAKAWTFTKWQSTEQSPRTWTNEIKGQFTEKETTIIAQYADVDNIIPYDPSKTDPMPRPEGYVRVSFAADDGLKLTEQKAYYVKKNAGITLGNAKLAKPKYEAQTGYEFEKWDKEDTLEIKEDDVLVTAKAKALPDFDKTNHTGYVKVTFKAGENGVIKENGNTIGEKVYYVNPNKYVNLPAPTPDGNTGYDFSTWKSDKSQSDFSLANFVNYKENTVITAMFNQKDAVYPKLDGSTKPTGYVEVTFAITGQGGKIADSEMKTYYVDPTRQVSLKAPKTVAGTGYVFDKWRLGTNPTDQIINPADQRQYPNNTTIYGSFKKLEDIIPATNPNGTPNLQPIDYVAVLFIGGDHANKVDGQILYYVNPNADPAKTIGSLTKPTVTPDAGWKHTGWDVKDYTVIKDSIFVVAEYEALDDVVPALKDDGTPNKKPDGYVTVTFKSGDNGKIQEKGSDITEKVYYVNPAKYVNLTPPTTVPNTSYEFSTWESNGEDFILANNINFTEDTIITAKFNSKGDVIPKTKSDDSEKPQGFVTVNFVIDSSQAGKIKTGETITYFVRPNTNVTIQPPKTTANTGYEFDKWSIDTTEAKKYTTDTIVKGEFTKLDEIIPFKNPDGTVNAKPEGYVIVNFLKGEHGVLDGKTTFYVNPKAGKTLNDLDTKGITVVPSPTYKFDKWDKPMSTPISGSDNINVTATYTQLPNIIKAGPKDTAPDGYVAIIFETDGRGTITGNKAYEDKTNPKTKENEIVYFVNPKKNIKLAKLADGATPAADELAIPTTTPNEPDKYIFDQWRAVIDTTTPITRGRVHIAMFKPKEVKLTYDANGATGTVPSELTVDYNSDVRLAGKGNLAKKDAKFLGWKIGDKTYQAGDQINLKEDTTAYAQWDDDKKIIEYDPVNNPTTRPDDTYVRVTFAVEDGLKLTAQKAYYVKKDAGIKLDDTNLAKPGHTVETGYKFDKWDKEDSLEITTDVLVTAKSTKLGTVIPEKKDDGNKNDKPEGYKEVVFKVKDEDQSKGTLEGVTKFYVNPTEYVTINPPTTKANTGFEFGGWDKDAKIPTVYDKDTVITASFNELNDVIPKTKPDGTENKKPEGYNTVTFVIDPATGGKIADKEVTVYYVNPAKEVTVSRPKTQADTGYEFEKWDADTTTAKKYTEDTTTVKGNFKKLEDIIPSTDEKGKPNAKPEGYVTVTFKAVNGTLAGTTVYYVNPKVQVSLADTARAIKKTPNVGYKIESEKWSNNDSKALVGTFIKDTEFVFEFAQLDDVIPSKKDDGTDKPEGYFTVTFSTETNGKIKDTNDKTKKVLYVNPNKAVVLQSYAPEVTPNTGNDFAGWDTQIDKKIQYENGAIIKAKYNTKDNVIPKDNPNGGENPKPSGYFTVTFVKGDHGELSGKTVYYVKSNTEVTVPAPTVKPNTGWKQKDSEKAWDKKLTQTFSADTTITAQYEALAEIIPEKEGDTINNKPEGYKTVKFVGENGTLEGTTVYYVNPEKVVDLNEEVNGLTKKPGFGYTAKGGTWSSKEFKKQFTDDETTFKFTFKKLDDVIPENNTDGSKNEKPDGYVTVTLIPTDKATDAINKVYFVNPKAKDVTITNKPEGKKEKVNNIEQTYNFKGWKVTKGTVASWDNENIKGTFIQDTEITAQYSTNVVPEKLVPAPVAKKNVVTPKGDKPNPEDLITNIPGSKENPLPDGTKITYEEEPDVNNPGDSKAKVKIEYPNGKTVVVEVPVTVVDNVVQQKGKDKPLVPESYVKVIVDTTDKAEENTRFEKTFWVKPKVEVTIPGILAPTGKQEKIDGVTKTNKFVKWKLEGSNPEKFYETEIKDTFTDKAKIVATYEQDKNVEPKINEGQWIPQGSSPNAKDFIANPYNDDDPNNKDNLPPGTKIEFVPGKEPNTTESGKDKETTIKITYPNGETKVIPVKYNVTGDVVEQEKGKEKPAVPDDYVKVVVKTTDMATDETKFERTFWVTPNKEVTITVNKPTGKSDADKKYVFDSWKWNNKSEVEIKDTFTAQETVIVANYKTTTEPKEIVQIPEVVSDVPIVSLNQSDIEKDWFNIRNKIATDSKIKTVVITEKPATDSLGMQYGKAKVTFENGTSRIITIKLKVVGDVIETIDEKRTKDVPKNYKLVILDTTSDAMEPTMRYFWINPDKDITLKAFKPQGKSGKVFDKWERNLSINWNKEGIKVEVLTIKAIYKDAPISGSTDVGVVEKHGNRYVERVAGLDRVHTAIYTSRRFFNKSKYVIIADSGNYPDALTATVLANVLNAPILLNNTKYLEGDVAKEITRLGATEVIIVGGHKSISENVKSQLAKYDQNKVQRIWGRDRYVTSSQLAYEIQRLTGKVNKAIIASGENFPDALATAPLGSKEIAPILLVTRNQMDLSVRNALRDLNIKKVYVAGGHNSVSSNLESQLPAVIRRFNGQDRYETAILVASYTYPESKEVFVASGEVFPDALVIGPVCARRKAPILLSKTTPVKATDDYIEKSKIEYLYIIGGVYTIHVDTAHKYAIED